MEVEIVTASIADKFIIRNLMEMYRHDLSEFNYEDVGQHGFFGYMYLDHYWTEADRLPFIIKVSGKLAGFVLVRTIEEDTHSIAEFFIMRKYRRQGIGQTVACRVFDMFPGKWKVAQEGGNVPAQVFWRKVISDYTDGNYREVLDDDWAGYIQEFSNHNVRKGHDPE